MSTDFLYLPLLTTILVGGGFLLRRLWTTQKVPYPPGPTGWPILGNALILPNKQEWLTYTAWGKVYGEIVHVSAFGQHIVILDSAAVIAELLEKRSAIYSDRPVLPMAGELVGYVDTIPLSPHGDRHRASRKLLAEVVGQRKMPELYALEEEKTAQFMRLLHNNPANFIPLVRRHVATVVFKISHGYTVQDENDPLIQLAKKADDEFCEALVPGSFLVDIFPILRYIPSWFPGASFKRQAIEWRKTVAQMRDEPYDMVKQQILQGTALPSFTESLITRNPEPTSFDEDIYKWASVALYTAGSDTTVASIESFFHAMMIYPDVQKRAQAELTTVVGPLRFPSFEDRPHLPYCEALVKEILRWNPVANLAIPHRLTQDDVYNGYLLPAGTIVMPNSWGILHDPDLYPEPYKFNPERYLSSTDVITDKESVVNPDPQPWAFGYGRRVCPGRHLAYDMLYISVVMVLSVFDISKPVDGVEPVVEYTSGTISHPHEFQCKIKPRSAEAEALLCS